MRLALASTVAALQVASAQAARASALWENGDFLIPAPKSGTFALVDTGERYGVWRVVGEPGTVSWVSGTYRHRGFSFPAAGSTPALQAEPWVNLAGISMSATGIMHAPVPTTVGQPYTLTFYVGNLVNPGGYYGVSSTVNVYQNAALIGTATNGDGQGTMIESWKPFSITFTATAAYTTIAFINADPAGDMNCGVSNTDFAPASAMTRAGLRP